MLVKAQQGSDGLVAYMKSNLVAVAYIVGYTSHLPQSHGLAHKPPPSKSMERPPHLLLDGNYRS